MSNLMRNGLAALAVSAVCVLSGGRAEACGGGGDSKQDTIVFVALAVVGSSAAIDIGFTAYDLTKSSHNEHPSRIAGGVELALTGIQAVLGGTMLLGQSSFRNEPLAWAWTAWNVALAGHGIWALSTSAEAAPTTASRQPRLFPTVVSDGVNASAGLGLVGTF